MRCVNCGEKLHKFDSACPKCFTRVVHRCSNCNRELFDDSRNLCNVCRSSSITKNASSKLLTLSRVLAIAAVVYFISPDLIPTFIDDLLISGTLGSAALIVRIVYQIIKAKRAELV